MTFPFFETVETQLPSSEPHSLRTNGSQTTRHYISNGSPEGAITAVGGSTCTDATTGIHWRKQTGSGNTGWALQSGRVTRVDTASAAQEVTFDGYENELRTYRSEGENTLTILAGSGKTFAGGGTYISIDSNNDSITLMLSGGVIEIVATSPAGGGIADGDKGDITVSASGSTWTIDSDSVTTAKIANAAVTDAKLASNSVVTAKIADNQVTNAKLANMTTQTFKGRRTSGTGDPEDITIAQARLMLRKAKYALTFSTSQNWDLDNGLYQVLTATNNFTLNFPSNAAEGETAFIYLTHNSAYTLTLASGFKTPGGNPIVLSTGTGAVDRLMFFFDTDITCTVTILQDIK